MATNYQKLGHHSRQGFSQRLNSTEEKKFPTSRKLPDWVWKALVKILGIKLKGQTRVSCLSVFLQAITLLLACVFSVTGMIHTVYDVKSSSSQTTLTIGCSNIVIGFGWVCLGIYSQKLAGRLFSNRNFSESVRIHSRTFFKISAVGLVTFLSVTMIALNCYSDFSVFGPNNCDTIFLHNSICHIMYSSHVAFSIMSLIWNLLVCCILLSVCRTHTMGKSMFIHIIIWLWHYHWNCIHCQYVNSINIFIWNNSGAWLESNILNRVDFYVSSLLLWLNTKVISFHIWLPEFWFAGLRKFGMLLEEDARNYVQRFQKQEPVHLSLLNQVVSGKYQCAIVLRLIIIVVMY